MRRATASTKQLVVGMSTFVAALFLDLGDGHAAESSRLAYLRGDGAEHCPDEKALRVAVAVRLGYDPFVAWAKTTVHAQLGREGSNLRARVYLADENGHIRGSRELSAPGDDCPTLVAAVALAISIAIDPMSVSAPSSPQNRDGNREETPVPVRTELPVVAAAPPTPSNDPQGTAGERSDARSSGSARGASSSSSRQWYAGVGTHLASGTAPNLAGGLSGFARLDVAAASIALEGRYDWPASGKAASGRGVVSSTLLLASLEPCFRLSPVSFCGLLSVGSLRGSGAGVTLPIEQSALYWGAGGRVVWELGVIDPMLLRAHVDVVGNATRTTLAIGGSEVWRAPPLAAAAGIDVVARVW